LLQVVEARHFAVAGPPDLRAAFRRSLPKELKREANDFVAEVHANQREIAIAAESAQRVIEEREELATIERLRDVGPSRSAWGERATLDAVRDGRVLILIVDDMFTKPGASCAICATLWEQRLTTCAICGNTALDTVEDVVEITIERVLEQSAALEILRSPGARRLMSNIGRMAALLRW
jgi:peptide subunit release factor 1 (eRF1)